MLHLVLTGIGAPIANNSPSTSFVCMPVLMSDQISLQRVQASQEYHHFSRSRCPTWDHGNHVPELLLVLTLPEIVLLPLQPDGIAPYRPSMDEQDGVLIVNIHMALSICFQISSGLSLASKRQAFLNLHISKCLGSTAEVVVGRIEKPIRATYGQSVKILGPCQHPRCQLHPLRMKWTEGGNTSRTEGKARKGSGLGTDMQLLWMVVELVTVGLFMCYM